MPITFKNFDAAGWTDITGLRVATTWVNKSNSRH